MPAPDAVATPSVGEALHAAATRLRASGSPTPRLDAELLLGHVLGHDRAWLLAHPEHALATDAAAELVTALDRRAAGEPIAYIRGFKEWHGLRLLTDARALIPRPETEVLADAAVAEIVDRLGRDTRPLVAWDVGTGSGAIAVVLALRFGTAARLGRLRLVASDDSAEALALAGDNLRAHGVQEHVTLVRGDLLDAAPELRPDVVVANLPYVSAAEVAQRMGSLAFEPPVALDGGPDGLDVIARFLATPPTRIPRGATLLLEIGAGQADSVSAMAPAGASVLTEVDLAGIERVVRIDLP